MTPAERYRLILCRHLPEGSVEWVYQYLARHRVHLHITRRRRSKLGDYRRPYPGHDFHEISINGDLNRYLFLWVFLHEAAHLETHLLHPLAQPHGHEWQAGFARLLREHRQAFPPEVQPLLERYTARLPLPRTPGRQIEAALRLHDPGRSPDAPPPTLDSLPAGSRFRLATQPGLLFLSVEKRRTRWLCRCLDNGRLYTVRGDAEVQPGA
ncbi:MAG: hypothetical protein J6I49_00250 [Bacteroidales bacterium]|nr:hypothetical protein [Bacteroidales bacterium]